MILILIFIHFYVSVFSSYASQTIGAVNSGSSSSSSSVTAIIVPIFIFCIGLLICMHRIYLRKRMARIAMEQQQAIQSGPYPQVQMQSNYGMQPIPFEQQYPEYAQQTAAVYPIQQYNGVPMYSQPAIGTPIVYPLEQQQLLPFQPIHAAVPHPVGYVQQGPVLQVQQYNGGSMYSNTESYIPSAQPVQLSEQQYISPSPNYPTTNNPQPQSQSLGYTASDSSPYSFNPSGIPNYH